MEKHFTCVGELGDGRDLIACVNRPELCCLRDADHAWFMRMQLVLARDHGFHLSNVDFTISAADQKQLRSLGEKFRRAAFVGLKMGILVADNALKRLAKLRER